MCDQGTRACYTTLLGCVPPYHAVLWRGQGVAHAKRLTYISGCSRATGVIVIGGLVPSPAAVPHIYWVRWGILLLDIVVIGGEEMGGCCKQHLPALGQDRGER